MTHIFLFSQKSDVLEAVRNAVEEVKKWVPEIPLNLNIQDKFVPKTPPKEFATPCMILVDADMDGKLLTELLTQANKFASRNKYQARIICIGSEKGEEFRREIAGFGARDYWLMPLDSQYIISSLRFWLKPVTAVLEMAPAKNDAFQIQCELSVGCEISQISEFGLQVKTDKSFEKNEMVWIQLPGGKEVPEFKEPFLGRIYKVVEAKKDDKKEIEFRFMINLVFLGIPDNVLKAIRTWIRREYAKNKTGS